MHFHLPRRQRRRLLLPPGLLALAGLLLVGGLALRPWQERLAQRSVLQLTLPPFRHEVSQPTGTPTIRWYLPAIAEARTMRPWHDAYFTGISADDALEQNRIVGVANTILVDSMKSNGIRVRFAKQARYAQLIFLLNLMEQEGFRKYWVDLHHAPITFYALTDAYEPPTEFNTPMLCGGVIHIGNSLPLPLPFWVRFDNGVTDFWQIQWLRQLWQPGWWQPLQQPEWRLPLGLLALLFLLNIRCLLASRSVQRSQQLPLL